MMNKNFDPYDVLINLQGRLERLETAHNKMAAAFQLTENELNVALFSLRNLQKEHIKLLKTIEMIVIDNQKG
jgi:hypothetical protein